MGEKKKGGEKKNGDGGEKKEDSPITVVLKTEIHCEGCATKIRKIVQGFEGVEQAKAESDSNKVTVIGKVEPSKLRDELAEKLKRKVDLISPQPSKKENNDDKKKGEGKNNNNNTDDKKPKEKEPPITTAVLKLSLHCTGCMEKVQKVIKKTKGYHDMSMDRQKDLVTVKGTMDMKALAQTLSERLKKPVEIVPPKKEKDANNAGEKDGGNKGGGGGKKKGGGGDGGKEQQEGGGGGGARMEEISRMEIMGNPVFAYGYGYGYPNVVLPVNEYGYPPGYTGQHLHAPQLFSDENPNACSIM